MMTSTRAQLIADVSTQVEGSQEWVGGVIIFGALGTWLLWNARKTWRGEAGTPIFQPYNDYMRQEMKKMWPLYGNRRTYRAFKGMGLAGAPLGAGFIAAAIAIILTYPFGMDPETSSGAAALFAPAAVLIGAGAVYCTLYLLVGVPDWLRPPCQRGWQVQKGELEMVRPWRNREHPKRRAPSPSGDPFVDGPSPKRPTWP